MIIGLIGRKRSGKDTVAAHLVENYGHTRLAFADGVRDALYRLNPLIADRSDWDIHRVADLVDAVGWENAKEDTEIRSLLQRMGTDAVRDVVGEEAWVKALERKVDQFPILQVEGLRRPITPRIVITDVRFPNEAEYVIDEGGTIVRILRPDTDMSGDTHISETALDFFSADVTLVNDGTVEDLHREVDEMMRSL